MKTECQVLLLTNRGPIYQTQDGKLSTNPDDRRIGFISCNLYIFSNDDIKKGDWVFNPIGSGIKMVNADVKSGQFGLKKIIATTDIRLELPSIPQSFIEEYCKNPVDTVMVEYEKFRGVVTNAVANDPDTIWDGSLLDSRPKLINNEIFIHPVKDSWSRDEVKSKLEDLIEYVEEHNGFQNLDFESWIEENLK